jgi:hypothetical protein
VAGWLLGSRSRCWLCGVRFDGHRIRVRTFHCGDDQRCPLLVDHRGMGIRLATKCRSIQKTKTLTSRQPHHPASKFCRMPVFERRFKATANGMDLLQDRQTQRNQTSVIPSTARRVGSGRAGELLAGCRRELPVAQDNAVVGASHAATEVSESKGQSVESHQSVFC